MQLVLSLFTGVGLFDKAFREAGFCVVSAGDIIYGQDIREFKGILNKFDGVIGGPPCQLFSDLNRDRSVTDNYHYGLQMLDEFVRIVKECDSTWFLFENVRNVPNVKIDNYSHQRIDINQGWYENTTRLRHIQFGHKDNLYIQWERGKINPNSNHCALASDNRSFKELCKLQGLKNGFNLPDFTVKGKKKLVGNGVPLSMGRVIANAVKDVTDPDNKCDLVTLTNVTARYEKISVNQQSIKICRCGCGRIVTHKGYYYDFSCRKRYQRSKVGENGERA
ncbi:DNA cytosine methyltransferase [Sulfurimonas sp.]|uniref:DNA cytosine methyltransferase n=1 Tax=Sulfurimonas sp. TaxID=2022749 RepID=UPI0025E597B9|nr:DNA cytosine methyltransferase [Sulfurimonas sp.]